MPSGGGGGGVGGVMMTLLLLSQFNLLLEKVKFSSLMYLSRAEIDDVLYTIFRTVEVCSREYIYRYIYTRTNRKFSP